MDCELCGTTTDLVTAQVEGVRMRVCTACAQHGTIVKERPSAQRKTFAQQVNTQSVHPDTPKFLRAYREQQGLTQEAFAAQLHMKSSAYQHLENGSRTASIETAKNLGKKIGKNLVVFLKTETTSYGKSDEAGLTLGDFIKRR